MCKKLIIVTRAKPVVLTSILRKYGVKVYKNQYDYKEMRFEDDENFKDTFFTVMEYLANERIYVTVLDMLVQVGDNPETAEYPNFTNWRHTKYSRVNYFENEK